MWNVAAHAELYLGKAANNQLFWEGVQKSFQGQDTAMTIRFLQMKRF